MGLYRWIIAGLWLLFIAYWAAAAMGAKRSARRGAWRTQILPRLVMVLLIVALLQSRTLRQFLVRTQHALDDFAIVGWIGVALCLAGFGLAFDARHHLGRNWGVPMARKEQPELITSGPYARIRHPIYAGLIVAMLGSAIGVNLLWLPLLVLAGAYFIYSARSEEAVMLQLFPAEYAAYRVRTGMFVPRLRRLR